ncbi:hypothetical protein IF1G_03698 [Cordyceps javanica]|uniref:Uncharacterized protein n=1 Tax=Cordyceps javanica TaxID=43265 RepID=A0A545V8C2_9HYPO|nr:hypothetical protein IF1G_03698 [Cordyceps javanica]
MVPFIALTSILYPGPCRNVQLSKAKTDLRPADKFCGSGTQYVSLSSHNSTTSNCCKRGGRAGTGRHRGPNLRRLDRGEPATDSRGRGDRATVE